MESVVRLDHRQRLHGLSIGWKREGGGGGEGMAKTNVRLVNYEYGHNSVLI